VRPPSARCPKIHFNIIIASLVASPASAVVGRTFTQWTQEAPERQDLGPGIAHHTDSRSPSAILGTPVRRGAGTTTSQPTLILQPNNQRNDTQPAQSTLLIRRVMAAPPDADPCPCA
jgi:hypothetical protein